MNFLKTLGKFSIGTWIQAGMALLTTPIIAWFITPEEFGKSSMFTLAYNLLLNIVMLALDQGFARHYNDTPNKSVLLRGSLTPIIITTAISILLIEIFKHPLSVFLYSNNDTSGIHMLSLSLVTGILLRISTIAIRMQGSALKFSVIQIVQAIVNFIGVILFAWFVNQTFVAILVGIIFSQVVGAALAISYNYKLWKGIFSTSGEYVKFIRPMLRYSLPFVPTFLLSWVFQGVDKTFLRAFSNFAELGLYATATKIAFSLNVIQTGFTTFWFPYSLDRYKNNPDDKEIYKIVFNVLSFVFGLLIFGIILFQKLLLLVLPASYHGVLPIFPLLLLIPMLYTLSEVTVVGVTYKKRTFQHLYVTIFSCITNILFAYLLIPAYGAIGASVSMMFGYFTFFIFRTYYGHKGYALSLDIKKFVVAIAMILAALLLTVVSSGYYYPVCIAGMIIITLMYKNDLLKIRKL